jgi:hypothetical protein
VCNRLLGSLGCGPPAPSASILPPPSPPPPSPRNPPPLRAPGLPSPPHLPWRCRSRRAGHALIQVAGREEPGPGLGIEQRPPGGGGGGQRLICRLQGRRAPPGARHSGPRGTAIWAAPGGLGRFRGPPLPPLRLPAPLCCRLSLSLLHLRGEHGAQLSVALPRPTRDHRGRRRRGAPGPRGRPAATRPGLAASPRAPGRRWRPRGAPLPPGGGGGGGGKQRGWGSRGSGRRLSSLFVVRLVFVFVIVLSLLRAGPAPGGPGLRRGAAGLGRHRHQPAPVPGSVWGERRGRRQRRGKGARNPKVRGLDPLKNPSPPPCRSEEHPNSGNILGSLTWGKWPSHLRTPVMGCRPPGALTRGLRPF